MSDVINERKSQEVVQRQNDDFVVAQKIPEKSRADGNYGGRKVVAMAYTREIDYNGYRDRNLIHTHGA